MKQFSLTHTAMRSRQALALGLLLCFPPGGSASDSLTLDIRRSNDGLDLSWPAVRPNANGTLDRPYFELQRSADLQHWQPIDQRMRSASSMPGAILNLALTPNQPTDFYRLLAISPPAVSKLGSGGEQVFGYADAFAQELERIGQISVNEFATLFPSKAAYLPGISWNPTDANYWDAFNADPNILNADKEPGTPGFRSVDYRLYDEELTLFRKNGFVVNERLGAPSFAEVFYDLWRNDLPVFISTDALLQAWHRTYDAMLEEVEETYLFASVEAMLDGMAGQVASAANEVGNTVLRDSLGDADYFVAVARSLLAGKPVPGILGQDSRVAATLAGVQGEQLQRVNDFMGFCRMVDFSQFKVRGHYTHSERLGRYFKTLMWLGRIDVPVAGGPFERCYGDKRMASPRELGMAIVLWHLLNSSGRFDTWANADRVIQTFVGVTDSMTFGQLGGLLAGAGIQSVRDVPDLATLERLQADIARGELGVQNIRSDWFYPLLGQAGRYALPQIFTVLGQKFTPDSWVFSQTTFDSIRWTTEDGATNWVERRVPSALDAAFAVLGNDQIVPELVAQINGTFTDENRPHAKQWRDGFPYQHNLAAARAVLDQQTMAAWQSNLYMNWLGCLRELSSPTSDPNFPEVMRTRAWAMKTLNTQLASWTQLRHDTILYAKQSYTPHEQCLYPTGFVEPRPEFWNALGRMAQRAGDLIASLPYAGNFTVENCELPALDPQSGNVIRPGECTNQVSLAAIQARQVRHLAGFAATVRRLERLVAKQMAQECFNGEDERFIDGLMEERGRLGGCAGPTTYSGWYPGLFYRNIHWEENRFHRFFGAGAFDALVADVHTDLPTDGDPGSVLHQAVGRVNLLMMAVENGPDRFVCAGPVLSHYEFEVIGSPRRLDDNEWQNITSGSAPPDVPADRLEGIKPPAWTRGYLVTQ